MTPIDFGERLQKRLHKKLPHSAPIVVTEFQNLIAIELNSGMLLYINQEDRSMEIFGKGAKTIFSLHNRLDLHFVHWTENPEITHIRLADNSKHFLSRVEFVILLLMILDDIKIDIYFDNKVCSGTLKRTKYNARFFITEDNACYLTAEIGSKVLQGRVENIMVQDKLKDPIESEGTLGELTEGMIDDAKEEDTVVAKAEAKSAPKKTAVYGDAVENKSDSVVKEG